MNENRLLVIGDAGPLRGCLEPKGYTIEQVGDTEEGIDRALSGDCSLVVISLPAPLDLLQRIRELSMVPILTLLPTADDTDRIACLEQGADDCFAHPCNPRELVARVRSIQRRAGRVWPPGEEPTGEVLVAGDLTLDTSSREVKRKGEPVPLTGVEFSLLEMLVRAAGRPLSREALTRQVLRRRFSPFDRSIDVHVSSLRKKIGAERIHTVRGVGYLFTS